MLDNTGTAVAEQTPGAQNEPLADSGGTPNGTPKKGKFPSLNSILVKRDGQTFVRFRDTIIAEGFNVRDLSAPDNAAHVEWFRDHIFGVNGVEVAEGVRSPVRGYYKEGKICLTSGHCRRAAVDLGIAEELADEDFQFPLTLESHEATPGELAESILIDNSGKPLAPHEQATAMFVLHSEHGYSLERVAVMVNPPMTSTQAKNYLLLARATPSMVKWMRDGVIAPTTIHQAIAHFLPRNYDDKGMRQAVRNAEAALKQCLSAVKDSGAKVTGAVFKTVSKQLTLTPAVGAPEPAAGAQQDSLDLSGGGGDAPAGDSGPATPAAPAATGKKASKAAAPAATPPAAPAPVVVEKAKRRTQAQKEMAYELVDCIGDIWADAHVKPGAKEVVITMSRADYDKLNKLVMGETNAAPAGATGGDDGDEN